MAAEVAAARVAALRVATVLVALAALALAFHERDRARRRSGQRGRRRRGRHDDGGRRGAAFGRARPRSPRARIRAAARQMSARQLALSHSAVACSACAPAHEVGRDHVAARELCHAAVLASGPSRALAVDRPSDAAVEQQGLHGRGRARRAGRGGLIRACEEMCGSREADAPGFHDDGHPARRAPDARPRTRQRRSDARGRSGRLQPQCAGARHSEWLRRPPRLQYQGRHAGSARSHAGPRLLARRRVQPREGDHLGHTHPHEQPADMEHAH